MGPLGVAGPGRAARRQGRPHAWCRPSRTTCGPASSCPATAPSSPDGTSTASSSPSGRGTSCCSSIARITGFDVIGDRVRAVRTSGGNLDADEVVLAAGAGIRSLGRMLGLRLEVIAGQGYNVALATSARLAHPVIVEEAHAVATPFADRIRLGGTMEFAGDSPTVRRRGGSTPSCGRCGPSSTSTGSHGGRRGPARAR